MNEQTWDIGDPEPVGVQALRDGTDGGNEASPFWRKASCGEWKGYKDGGKVYIGWAELVRRWGPVRAVGS